MSNFLEIVKGTNISLGTATKQIDDDVYNEIRSDNFTMYVHEWSFKFGPTEAHQGKIQMCSDAQYVIDTAKSQGKKLKGHCLVWYIALPPWYSSLTIPQKQSAMEFHVRNMVRMFKGQVYKWDVVNETIDDKTHTLRSFWTELGGEAMIQKCFEWAHEEDPNAILVINDYATTAGGPKADALLDMVSRLRSAGCPIHEVGFQTHENIRWMNDAWFENMKTNWARFKKIGVTVNISELDLGAGADEAQQQATCYYNVYKTALADLSLCNEVTLWEFSSKYTWLHRSPTDKSCPCPWDNNNLPQPAVEAIAKALREIVSAIHPTPTPTPIPTPTPQSLEWVGFGCTLIKAGTVYKTSNRTNTWNGPQILLQSGKHVRFQVNVVSSVNLQITMRGSDDNSTWTYQTLANNALNKVDISFTTPSNRYVQLYLEGAPIGTDFSVSDALVSYS